MFTLCVEFYVPKENHRDGKSFFCFHTQCYGLNCVPPKFMHRSLNLTPVPQKVTIFRGRAFKEVIKLE